MPMATPQVRQAPETPQVPLRSWHVAGTGRSKWTKGGVSGRPKA